MSNVQTYFRVVPTLWGRWRIKCNFVLAFDHPLDKLDSFDTRAEAEQALLDWEAEHAD